MNISALIFLEVWIEVRVGIVINTFPTSYEAISHQCLVPIPPENIVHTIFVFRGYRKGALKWNGLMNQPTFTCSKLTKETLEQGVKYVQG